MPTTYGCGQEEYVLNLDIPSWCAMSPPPTPEAEKTAKPPPTIPATYKIPQKTTTTLPTAPETPSKTLANNFSSLFVQILSSIFPSGATKQR
uniref:Uncharacterized protein n=1 Tax=Romanomermis culicivorax TaxID=13658 RepID=A0A915KYC2_ROMCU